MQICNYDTRDVGQEVEDSSPRKPNWGGSKKENFNHATTMVVVLRTVAAQDRVHQAKPAPPAEIHFLCVELIAAISLTIVSTAATP